MRIQREYIRAKFIERPNRFVAYVMIEQEEKKEKKEKQKLEKVHVPDSGRMTKLLEKNGEVLLEERKGEKRKTNYTMVAVRIGEKWVNIDSQITNKLFEEEYRKIELLKRYTLKKREVVYKKSRLDFLLEDEKEGTTVLVEIKSVTLAEGKTALFPDAPTIRGSKHLEHLIEAKKQGKESFVVFIVKREEVKKFSPNWRIDQKFAETLKKAYKEGVKIIAIKARYEPIEENILELTEEIEVELE